MPTFTKDLPPEIAAQYEAIARRQALNDALTQRTLTPRQTQHTGGKYSRAVPFSPLEGGLNLVQAALLKRGRDREQKALQDLATKYQGEQQTRIRDYERQRTGGIPMRAPDPTGAAVRASADAYLQGSSYPETIAGLIPEPTKPISVGPGAALYEPGVGEIYKNPKLTPDTAIDISLPGTDKLADEWAKMEVGNYGENLKSAESAAVNLPAMERFLASSDLASEGAAQPLFTFVKGLATSFGVDFESLTAETIGDQANKQVLARFMSELGARGLTDQDMKVLKDSLPKLSSSREAREEVARILMISYDKTLSDFSHRFEKMATKAEVSHMAYKPRFLEAWEKNKGLGNLQDVKIRNGIVYQKRNDKWYQK